MLIRHKLAPVIFKRIGKRGYLARTAIGKQPMIGCIANTRSAAELEYQKILRNGLIYWNRSQMRLDWAKTLYPATFVRLLNNSAFD